MKASKRIINEIKRQIYLTSSSLLHLKLFGRYPFHESENDYEDYDEREFQDEFVLQHEIDKMRDQLLELDAIYAAVRCVKLGDDSDESKHDS